MNQLRLIKNIVDVNFNQNGSINIPKQLLTNKITFNWKFSRAVVSFKNYHGFYRKWDTKSALL